MSVAIISSPAHARQRPVDRTAFRTRSDDELAAIESSLVSQLATVEARWDDIANPEIRTNTIAVDAFQTRERLRDVRFEIELRRRVIERTDDGQRECREQAWADLAAHVVERTNLVELFVREGFPLTRRGRDARRAGGCEYSGPTCPNPGCGAGTDRFHVWDGLPGRFWCRRCRVGGDAIDATQLIRGVGFRDAVRMLADALTLPAGAVR